jgi:predicted nucleotidyltransferase
MATATITREDVFEAADRIDANGESPSAPKIRDLLGTGGFSKIQRHLNEWREARKHSEQEQQPQAPDELHREITQRLAAPIKQAVNEVYNQGRRDGTEAAEMTMKAIEEKANRIETEHAEALHNLDKVQSDLDAAKAETARKDKEIDQLQQQLSTALTALKNLGADKKKPTESQTKPKPSTPKRTGSKKTTRQPTNTNNSPADP